MIDSRTGQEIVSPADQPAEPQEVRLDGHTVQDRIFGTHGWYTVWRQDVPEPGEEFKIQYTEFSERIKEDLKTRRQAEQESSGQ